MSHQKTEPRKNRKRKGQQHERDRTDTGTCGREETKKGERSVSDKYRVSERE